MSLRIFSAGLVLLLSACGGPPEGVAPGDPANVATAETGTPVDAPTERIACAIGDAAMAEACTVERRQDGDAQIIVIRHPDGGFRRLKIEGSQVTAADGAQPAAVTVRDGVADVAVAEARYRLPIAP